jgi:hypothetical protein
MEEEINFWKLIEEENENNISQFMEIFKNLNQEKKKNLLESKKIKIKVSFFFLIF